MNTVFLIFEDKASKDFRTLPILLFLQQRLGHNAIK